MTDYKEQILALRAEGKTYKQIVETTGAAKSTVAYYCGAGVREKYNNRRKVRRTDPVIAKGAGFSHNFVGDKNFTDKCNDFYSRKNGETPHRATLPEIREKVAKTDVCYLSGRPIDYADPGSYHFDHIQPVSQGGLNTIDNLGIATSDANMAKTDMELDYFLDLCYDILKHHGRI